MTVNQDAPAFVERRKQPRFKVNDDMAFAACPSELCIVGKIIDINKAGIAFKYAVDQTLPEALTELAILLSGAGFVVKSNPFRSVSDTEIIDHPTCNIMMRRHSGYFISSAPDLERFIENHTVGEV